jgi:hypothetical protein
MLCQSGRVHRLRSFATTSRSVTLTHQLKEPVMRKAILAIAFALAVVGAGVVVATLADPEPAAAGCSRRC